MSIPVYQDVPYTFHSVNVEEGRAMQACLALASLFADSRLPMKAVPFMQKLNTPLIVEGCVYRLDGIRLEVGKGTVGYQLLLKKGSPGDATAYRMELPRYPLLTRLHADGESVCPLTMVSGAGNALIYLLEVLQEVHPSLSRRMGPACLDVGKLLQKMARKGFCDGLSLAITLDSFALSRGPDIESEETVYAVPIR